MTEEEKATKEQAHERALEMMTVFLDQEPTLTVGVITAALEEMGDDPEMRYELVAALLRIAAIAIIQLAGAMELTPVELWRTMAAKLQA